ncbi:MAG: DEAD/DEAH box helicase, partial [Candidatus Absconditabacteria bacterium]
MNLKDQLKTTISYMSILSSSGINTLQDFFMFFPRGYEDRTNLKTLNEIKFDGSQQTTKGKISDKNMVFTRTGKKIIQFKFHDANGAVGHITFMNSQFVYSNTNVDQRYVIMGKPKLDGNKIVFWYPEMVAASEDEEGSQELYKTGRIYPIYTQLQGINHNWFSKKIWEQLDMIPSLFHEIFPQDFLQEFDLMDYTSMIKNLHYPNSLKDLDKAKYRLYFQKLLRIQLVSLISKYEYQNGNFVEKKLSTNWDLIKQFLETLPFELTNAQKVSLKQIVDDFHETKPMMRLMQGDVGSGKTVVAVAAAFYIVKRFGGQVALLAPTEVLANQHLLSIGKYLLPLGIRIELITGSTPAKQKEKIKQDLVSGNIQMIVGTHALIQDDIDFHDLQFAIIDEQHKFGVMQRSFFKRFHSPHLLQMTATPIPRSLALA